MDGIVLCLCTDHKADVHRQDSLTHSESTLKSTGSTRDNLQIRTEKLKDESDTGNDIVLVPLYDK